MWFGFFVGGKYGIEERVRWKSFKKRWFGISGVFRKYLMNDDDDFKIWFYIGFFLFVVFMWFFRYVDFIIIFLFDFFGIIV